MGHAIYGRTTIEQLLNRHRYVSCINHPKRQPKRHLEANLSEPSFANDCGLSAAFADRKAELRCGAERHVVR